MNLKPSKEIKRQRSKIFSRDRSEKVLGRVFYKNLQKKVFVCIRQPRWWALKDPRPLSLEKKGEGGKGPEKYWGFLTETKGWNPHKQELNNYLVCEFGIMNIWKCGNCLRRCNPPSLSLSFPLSLRENSTMFLLLPVDGPKPRTQRPKLKLKRRFTAAEAKLQDVTFSYTVKPYAALNLTRKFTAAEVMKWNIFLSKQLLPGTIN